MNDNVKIELLKYPTEEDWLLVKKCAFVTVGKDSEVPPTFEWKKKILAANHSPIRELKFVFRITNIPSWVSVHFARHIHAQPYIKSQRNDRQNIFDRNKAPQDTPVDMCYSVNAEELITIAHKRLCMKASAETRDIAQKMCDLVIKTNPEFEGLLVPLCYYRNGKCTEFDSCGYYKTYGEEK